MQEEFIVCGENLMILSSIWRHYLHIKYMCEKKKEGGRFLFSLPLVTRLGLEPKTPTLKV